MCSDTRHVQAARKLRSAMTFEQAYSLLTMAAYVAWTAIASAVDQLQIFEPL